MALKVKDVFARAKAAPRILKVIGAVAAADAIVILLAASLLSDQVDSQAQQAEQLKAQLATLRKKVDDSHKEIDRLPELRRQYDAAIADGVLADQDRLQLVARAQDLATQHRLLDLHYRLAPEDSEQLQGAAYKQISTPVDFTSSAYLDTDVFAYWSELLGKLQSHYLITKIQLDRDTTSVNDIVAEIRNRENRAPLKAEIEFRWVSLRKATQDAKK